MVDERTRAFAREVEFALMYTSCVGMTKEKSSTSARAYAASCAEMPRWRIRASVSARAGFVLGYAIGIIALDRGNYPPSIIWVGVPVAPKPRISVCPFIGDRSFMGSVDGIGSGIVP